MPGSGSSMRYGSMLGHLGLLLGMLALLIGIVGVQSAVNPNLGWWPWFAALAWAVGLVFVIGEAVEAARPD